jgi:hypothetical protein
MGKQGRRGKSLSPTLARDDASDSGEQPVTIPGTEKPSLSARCPRLRCLSLHCLSGILNPLDTAEGAAADGTLEKKRPIRLCYLRNLETLS